MQRRLEIRTIADLERIIDENPDIRENLRRKLLTDEERELPRTVAQLAREIQLLTRAMAEGFAEAAADRAAIRQAMAEGFAEAAADRAAMKEDIQDLKEGQTRLEESQARLEKSQARLEESQARLESGQNNLYGLVLEQTAARRLVPRICQELRLTRPRVLKSLDMNFPESLSDTLYAAAAQGRISEEDATAVLWADFIMQGASRDPDTGAQATTYVLAEVSGTLNNNDIQRAQERAATLGSATGARTIPATAATIIPAAQRARASAGNVQVFLLERN